MVHFDHLGGRAESLGTLRDRLAMTGGPDDLDIFGWAYPGLLVLGDTTANAVTATVGGR